MAKLPSLNPPSEHELARFIAEERFDLPIELDISLESRPSREAPTDGVLRLSWSRRISMYIFEYRRHGTPKALEDASLRLEKAAQTTNLKPLLIAPYLDETKLTHLRARNISALDLCGNASVISDDFAIWRTGQPNLYKTSSPIKNVFTGRSSIFARCFLLCGEYKSLTELCDFAKARTKSTQNQGERKLTLATASKVVKVLEQKLIVAKDGGKITLVNPEMLLEELVKNYKSPAGRNFLGTTSYSRDEIWERLTSMPTSRCIVTGVGSAARYGVLSDTEKLSLYVPDLARALAMLTPHSTKVFPNLELIEQPSEEVYFDCRPGDKATWASPVQSWLELASGGPREKEAADVLRPYLSDRVRNEGDGG